MKYKIIVNPSAGRGFGARSVPKIEQLFTAHGLDYDLVCTNWAGEAIELARQAVIDGYDTIVAAGGDGTYQEVVNGMLAADMHSADGSVVGTLGVLPVGSGCDFSWILDVPPDLEGACVQLAQHETKVIDVARVTVDGETRYFDNTVGIGFEGIVNIEASKIKYLRGMALYLPAVIKSIFLSLKPARSVIEYEQDGETVRVEGAYLMVDACNGARAGGAFFVAPDAKCDDGLLDILLVEDIPRLRMLALLPRFLKGTHVTESDVQILRSRRISMRSQDPLAAHADGELVCTNARYIECEIVPHRIRVVS